MILKDILPLYYANFLEQPLWPTKTKGMLSKDFGDSCPKFALMNLMKNFERYLKMLFAFGIFFIDGRVNFAALPI